MKAMSKLFYPFLSITRNPCSDTRVPCIWLFIPPQASEFHLLCVLGVLGFALQTLDPLTKFGLTPEGLSAYLIG